MKKDGIIIISLIVVIAVLSIILAWRVRETVEQKVYIGEGLQIIITSSNRVTVYDTSGTKIAENELFEEISIPEEIEEPEKYSNFIKGTINGGEVIAGFSKDEKKLYVGDSEYRLIGKNKDDNY